MTTDASGPPQTPAETPAETPPATPVALDPATLAWDARGLVPAIAQDAGTGEVLMLAWMNAESLRLTLETGRVTYWSRSRGELWRKGDTSGHVQELVEARADCDGDAVLLRVRQTGPACHTGARSCFFRVLEGGVEPRPAGSGDVETSMP